MTAWLVPVGLVLVMLIVSLLTLPKALRRCDRSAHGHKADRPSGPSVASGVDRPGGAAAVPSQWNIGRRDLGHVFR